MGIDGIGKNGTSGPAAPSSHSERSGAARPARTDRPFEVSAPEPANSAAARPVGAVEVPPTALERLRAGDLDVNGYVDVKVNDATTHLKALPAPELEAIRNALRSRMASDPTLVELVRTVTGGKAPEASPED